tara:strand:- start:504 stop:686 length:183 start_codon:yes stop_codon:yes gene_type:complete
MKKSPISPESFLKDLEGVLDLVKKVDNIDLEVTNLTQLNKILKNKEKRIKNKYKDLDTKE